MRLMREHYEPAETKSGYDCIRHLIERYAPRNPTVSDVAKVYRDFFSNSAWPGGYTIEFTTDSGDVFCADCAKKYFIMEKRDISANTYDEGPTMYCDDCNGEIESSYGDPEDTGNQ
jgi:hypothetical protein